MAFLNACEDTTCPALSMLLQSGLFALSTRLQEGQTYTALHVVTVEMAAQLSSTAQMAARHIPVSSWLLAESQAWWDGQPCATCTAGLYILPQRSLIKLIALVFAITCATHSQTLCLLICIHSLQPSFQRQTWILARWNDNDPIPSYLAHVFAPSRRSRRRVVSLSFLFSLQGLFFREFLNRFCRSLSLSMSLSIWLLASSRIPCARQECAGLVVAASSFIHAIETFG
jgi:hypothetical protein